MYNQYEDWVRPGRLIDREEAFRFAVVLWCVAVNTGDYKTTEGEWAIEHLWNEMKVDLHGNRWEWEEWMKEYYRGSIGFIDDVSEREKVIEAYNKQWEEEHPEEVTEALYGDFRYLHSKKW